MADYVRINVDGKDVEIPEFAYEKTMQEVLKVLKDSKLLNLKQTTDNKKEIKTAEELVKAQLQANKEARARGTLENTLDKKNLAAQKDQNEAINKQTKAIKENGKAQQGFLEKALNATAGSGGVFGGVLGGLTKFGKFLNPVTAGLAGLAKGIMAAVKFFLRLGQLDNTLFRRGFVIEPDQGVAGGIASFAAQAADAGLRLEQAAELAGEFATTFGEFGTKTVFQAIESTSDLIREQGYLGLSTAEIAAAVAESADVFRQLGMDLQGNPEQIAAMTTNLLQSSQAFSRLTNTSADLIRQTVIQASSMEAFTNALNMLPSQIRGATLQSAQTAFAGLAGFGPLGNELASTLSDSIGRGGVQFTQFGQDLARVAPNLMSGLQNLGDAVQGNGDVGQALDDFRKGVIDVNDNNRQFLRALEISGDPMAKTIINLANLAETIDDADMKMMAGFREGIEAPALGKAQAKLRVVIERLKAAFDKLFIAFMNENVVNGFLKTIEFVEEGLMKFVNYLKGDGFKAIRNAFNGLVNFISNPGAGFNSLLEGMTKTVGQGISAMIQRLLAVNIAGGDNEESLAKYDKMVESLRGAETEEERKKLIDQYYTELGGREKVSGAVMKKSGAEGSFNRKKLYEVDEAYKRYKLEQQIGQYFGGSIFGNKKPTEADVSKEKNKQDIDAPAQIASTRRSNIRIMPMFGDASEAMANETDSQKQIRLLEEQVELMREQLEANKKIASSSSETAATNKNLAAMKSLEVT
tara:strand:+ start:13027 stop:15279 length:2253 start_codon:yes stop_codon:yes gene_type:complete